MDKRFGFNGGRNSNEDQILDSDNRHEDIDPIYGSETNPQNRVQQQENVMFLRTQDLDYLAKYFGQIVDQAISKQIQPTQYGNNRNDFENKTLRYLELLFNGITEEDKATGKRYYSISKLLRNQDNSTGKIDSITRELQSLRQMVENQTKVIEEQASIIKMQHENIVRYENDVIYKAQKDLIMELIGIADQLRYTLKDYREIKDFDLLYNSIEDLTEWVDGSLKAVAVRQYVEHDSKELDRKRQEIVETQETSNPDEDGLIKSVLPGYIWSVPLVGSNDMQQFEERPRIYEFMIRPEQVARLKYVKPHECQIEQHEIVEETSQPESVVTESPDATMENKSEMDVQNPAEKQSQVDEKKPSWWDRWKE